MIAVSADGVAAVAAVLALAFSVYNLIDVRILREQQVSLEEFRSSVRAPLVIALEALSQARKQTQSLQTSANIEKNRDQISSVNILVSEALGALGEVLREADESRFSLHKEWSKNFDDEENVILQYFDKAGNSVRREKDIRDALRMAEERIRDFSRVIKSKIDDEIVNQTKSLVAKIKIYWK